MITRSSENADLYFSNDLQALSSLSHSECERALPLEAAVISPEIQNVEWTWIFSYRTGFLFILCLFVCLSVGSDSGTARSPDGKTCSAPQVRPCCCFLKDHLFACFSVVFHYFEQTFFKWASSLSLTGLRQPTTLTPSALPSALDCRGWSLRSEHCVSVALA